MFSLESTQTHTVHQVVSDARQPYFILTREINRKSIAHATTRYSSESTRRGKRIARAAARHPIPLARKPTFARVGD